MKTIDRLNATDVWIRAEALQNLDLAALSDPAVLRRVMELLNDRTFLSPSDADTPHEPNLIALITPPDQEYAPEEAVSGPEISLLSELAERALANELPGDEDALLVLLSLVPEAGSWIDRNFLRLTWTVPDALERYIDVLSEQRHPWISSLLRTIDQHHLLLLVRKLLAQPEPPSEALTRIADEHAPMLLDLLEKKTDPLPESLLRPITSMLDAHRDRATKLLSRLSSIEAVGYLALLDEARAARFRPTKSLDRTIAHDLVRRAVNNAPWFPFAELMPSCTPRVVMSDLAQLPKDLRIACYRALVAAHPAEETFEAAYELAKSNALDGTTTKSFWEAVEHRLRLSSSRSDHPFLTLRHNKPSGFDEELLRFLHADLLDVAIAATPLLATNLLPAECARVTAKIEAEVLRVERAWRQEQEDRQQDPSAHYYEDRKAPHSVLMLLDREWEDLEALTRQWQQDALADRIAHLRQVPWSEELRALSRSNR